MNNHYHLLLSDTVENGITKFVRKLNIGYAKYFNERHKRSGTLFQGRTKKVRVATNAHFLHILNYIHLNPLDFMHDAQQWRQKRISNSSKALAYVTDYRWSSCADYCGRTNFPDLLDSKFFKKAFPNYPKVLREYLKSLDMGEMKQYALE